MSSSVSPREARPRAAAMVEALRGIGYSVWTALADLVDNSISASAANVWISFRWNGSRSWISVLDDGAGLNSDAIAAALIPGSSNPAHERSPSDLGRFGLGLKTASFSQCRRLTVVSRPAGEAESAWRWDLDYVSRVDEWLLLIGMAPGSESCADEFQRLPQGTLVLWENLDRLVGSASVDDRIAHDAFLEQVDRVEEHLAMVFHRYLDGPQPTLRLFINGASERQRVKPWDPFLRSHPATQATPLEIIRTPTGQVQLQGFVLPHRDRLSEEAFRDASGPEGWAHQQGFYVYRNSRLLMPGGWLALGDVRPWIRDEPHKLARIRLDMVNTADAEWRVDIKKSVARPPDHLRPRLRDLARRVREQARRVFVYRGAADPNPALGPVERAWCAAPERAGVRYFVNRSHPVIREAITRSAAPAAIEAMLRVVEETVPVQRIWLDAIEAEQAPEKAFKAAPTTELQSVLDVVYRDLRSTGLSPADARRRLLLTEPFNDYPDLVAQLIN